MLKRILALAAILLVAGCHVQGTVSDPALNAEADVVFTELVTKQDDALVARMSKANDAAEVRAQLPYIQSLVAEGPPPQGAVVAYNNFMGTGERSYAVAKTYDYPDRVARVETVFIKEGEPWKVQSFNVNITMKPGYTPPIPEAQTQPVQVVEAP